MGSPDNLEYAWPELLDPADPWAGDEALPVPSDYDNYLRYGPPALSVRRLSRAAHDAVDAEFLATWRAIIGGRAPWSAIRPAAEALGVWGPVHHDRRPLDPAPEELDDRSLADHAEDWVPDIGLQSPDRVLGPWAEGSLPPRLRQAAAAIMVFSPLIYPAVSAMERYCRFKPRPPKPHRAALRVLGHAAPMLWRVEPDARLSPLLPIFRRVRPEGPVRRVPAAPAVVGRVAPGPKGWFLAAMLPLPAVPPVAPLRRRLQLELLYLRRLERRTTWEDLLRGRPELLYRELMTWAWAQVRDTERWEWAFPESIAIE